MASSRVVAAVRKEGGRKMSMYERQQVEKELSDLSVQLRGGASEKDASGTSLESRPDLLVNRPALLARKKKLEELLNKDDDLVVTDDHARGRLSAEAKQIEERVAKYMLTGREQQYRMGQRPQDYEFAVQKTVYQQKNYVQDLQRWQEIMRQLYPDDPEMCDVKRIKPK